MSEAMPRRLRCAVYTRVSTDDGLDQEYNSIDAQRDAGHAYIASQRAEGWIPVADDYDDPAYSSGNMDRPALKRLLVDRCPPWRAKRRRVVPGSREATRDTRRAEGAKGDPKGASERGVQSYGRPVCSRNELAMLWRNAG